MRARLIVVLACALLAGCGGRPGPVPVGSESAHERAVVRAATAGDALWYLTAAGRIAAIDVATGAHHAVAASGGIDLVAGERAVWFLRHVPPGAVGAAGTFRLSMARRGAAEDVPLPPDLTGPLGLVVQDGRILVLADKAVHERPVSGGAWSTRPLMGKWPSLPGLASATVIDDALYVGLNLGEFGGGVRRVDLRTGVEAAIERRDGEELCAGPLNADCDPVTALVPDRERAGCVLAAIGLSHMAHESGRVVRICGTRVELAFERGYATSFQGRVIPQSEPVLGLAWDRRNELWILSSRGLYRLHAGTMTVQPLEEPESLGGLSVHRPAPGLLVIATEANRALAVANGSAILVRFDE